MKHYILVLAFLILFSNVVMAQQGENQRIPLIGAQAPSFTSPSTDELIHYPRDFGKH